MKRVLLGCVVLILWTQLAFAQSVVSTSGTQGGQGLTGPQGTSGQQGMQRQGPPPEAIVICVGKTEGTSCTFTTPRGTLSGMCGTSPKGDFACRPSNAPQGGGSGMTGQTGDQGALPVQGQGMEGGTWGGTGQGAGGEMGMGAQRTMGPPPGAISACSSQASGATCTFVSAQGSMSGTCQPSSRGEGMVCRPNNPTQRSNAVQGFGVKGQFQQNPPRMNPPPPPPQSQPNAVSQGTVPTGATVSPPSFR